MLLRLSLIILMLVFHGCTGAVNSTLLSKYEPCTENCSTSTPDTISGELEILPDEGEIFSTPEGSDLVEITGSCKDLGRKANRILVQVFEGENDAAAPIIDNSIDVNCQDNISTTSLQSTAGVGKTCLLISQGIGLADTGQTTAQFPQCFNGRFGFKLRIGRVIRSDTAANDMSDTTNPKVRYLVKMRLRTTENLTSDSGAATMVVNRALYTPTMSVVPSRDNNRCEINLYPSKFRDIRYTLYTTWTGPTWAASGAMTNVVSGTVYVDKQPTFPPLGDGTTVEKFYHFGEPLGTTIGLMPGITYTYRLETADYSFRNVATPALTDYEVQFGSVAGKVERNSTTQTYSCTMSPAYVGNRVLNANPQAGTPNSCFLQLAGINTLGYGIEWRVSSTSPTWMITNPNDGLLVQVGGDAVTNCRSLSSCFVHGPRRAMSYPGTSAASKYIDANGVAQPFLANVTYYFAARHYRDTNGNSQFDPGVDQLAGDWSPATLAVGSSDFNHSCLFTDDY